MSPSRNPTISAGTLAVPELLGRAGFRLRGKTRADCIHCSGHSIATVSYTSEVAFCHRCGWKANTVTLARELGLLATDPESRRRRQKEARELAEYKRTIARFEAWRELNIRKYSAELRRLARTAMFTRDVLAMYPDCADAWDAFARYCHREADLNRMLDFLTCAKNSPWLEEDATIADVFDTWRKINDAQR